MPGEKTERMRSDTGPVSAARQLGSWRGGLGPDKRCPIERE